MFTPSQIHLDRLNTYFAVREIEMELNRVSPRKRRAEIRKLVKQVRRAYKGIDIQLHWR